MAKNKLIIIGSAILIAGQLILLTNPNSFQICMVSTVLRAIGMSPLNGYVFVMIGDAVEFGEWKTNIRQESFVFSSGSVGAKIGMGAASAVISGVMASGGCISAGGESVVQPESAIRAIQNLFIWGPVIVFAAVAVICIFYRLDEKLPGIMRELQEREKRERRENGH